MRSRNSRIENQLKHVLKNAEKADESCWFQKVHIKILNRRDVRRALMSPVPISTCPVASKLLGVAASDSWSHTSRVWHHVPAYTPQEQVDSAKAHMPRYQYKDLETSGMMVASQHGMTHSSKWNSQETGPHLEFREESGEQTNLCISIKSVLTPVSWIFCLCCSYFASLLAKALVGQEDHFVQPGCTNVTTNHHQLREVQQNALQMRNRTPHITGSQRAGVTHLHIVSASFHRL